MPSPGSWLLLVVLAMFVALPALGAWRRRRRSRLASEVAMELAAFAERTRRERAPPALDEELRRRLGELRTAELASLELAFEVARGDADLVADAAQRLALRLRRRVAFERKVLARTAPGLRRGALAACSPPLLAIGASIAGMQIPMLTQGVLVAVELAGCVLLWRLARVEV